MTASLRRDSQAWPECSEYELASAWTFTIDETQSRGYTAHQLRALWNTQPLTVRELRQITSTLEHDLYFGGGLLWTLLATKETARRDLPARDSLTFNAAG